ncbi:MAG: hypothetical protein MR024_03795 [Firmicutes bacterium]|nr:hypothetical protein [Bacillota bacterium]
MRKSTKIWLIIMIISNVAMLYFFEPMIKSINYVGGQISITPNWEAYVGFALSIIATVSGFVIFSRFLKSLSLSKQIFVSTIVPTITFMFLMFFFFNITSMEQVGVVAAIRDGLSINTSTQRYIWMAVVAVIYSIYLLITYFLLTKPVRKLEKALEIIKYGGEPKKSLDLGGSKEFRAIEMDLRAINQEIKENNQRKKVVEES